MADDYGDKTEAPTLRRRQEARRQGQLARSADLTAAVILLAALVLLPNTGPALVKALTTLLVSGLSLKPISPADLIPVARAVLPLLMALVIAAAAINLVQIGIFFRLRMDFGAVDPARGFERIFSGKSLGRVATDLLKLALVAWLAYATTRSAAERIVGLQQLAPHVALSAGATLVLDVAWRMAILLLALGIVDLFRQRWHLERDLRMTRQQVKDELRQMERVARAERKGGD